MSNLCCQFTRPVLGSAPVVREQKHARGAIGSALVTLRCRLAPTKPPLPSTGAHAAGARFLPPAALALREVAAESALGAMIGGKYLLTHQLF